MVFWGWWLARKMGKLTFSSSFLAVRMLPYSHRWKPNLSAQLRTLEKQPSVYVKLMGRFVSSFEEISGISVCLFRNLV